MPGRPLPPTRVLVALGLTVLAVVVLGAQTLLRGDDEASTSPDDVASTTAATSTSLRAA